MMGILVAAAHGRRGRVTRWGKIMNTGKNDMPKKVSRREVIKASSVFGIAAMASQSCAGEATQSKPGSLLTVHSRSETLKPWLMPAHFGSPQWQIPEGVVAGESLYDDVTIISIDYLTDEQKLKAYLPHPYELDGCPVVTVAYSMNRAISWLAGGDYNIISVTARAKFPGEVDQLTGNYALVLWEDLTVQPNGATRTRNSFESLKSWHRRLAGAGENRL